MVSPLLAALGSSLCSAVGNRFPGLSSAPPKKGCHGGSCGGMAHYPVGAGNVFYSEFDVPGLPVKLDGITYFIYFNIFFSGKGQGKMNQFVPQLMLGNPLCNSTGPPEYKPIWQKHNSWVFGSQYFMEINNTKTNNTAEGHAATGDLYPATAGEVIWTKFELSAEWVWTLSMGIKNDPARTSTVVSDRPFMGLVPESTKSWSEPEYGKCFVNSCWELYGVKDELHFPSTGSTMLMRTTTQNAGSIQWDTHWNSEMESGGCANTSISQTNTPTQQDVIWIVDKPYPPK